LRTIVGGTFHFDINGRFEEILKEHIRLVLLSSYGPVKMLVQVKGTPEYRALTSGIEPNNSKYDIIAQFPVAPDHNLLSSFCFNVVLGSTYPKEPDHDGHNVKGWRLFMPRTSLWESSVMFAIESHWIEYHK